MTREPILWELRSIDPETGDLPSDPFVGFLPPNVTGPEGEGFVNYSINPKADLQSGDRIDAQASIVFDLNEAIITPAIFNTIDDGTPTATVNALPERTLTTDFTVSWSGVDDAGGSGVATFDVFVSEDNGPFGPFLLATPETSAPLPW